MRLSRSNLSTIILVVAALAVGSVVTERLPQADAVGEAPFVHTAALGEPVSLRTGTVTVDGVSASPIVRQGGTSISAYSAAGTFLAVRVTFVALREPGAPSYATMRVATTDGRTFGNPGLSVLPACGVGQPGLARSCTYVFEVDPTALAGARLLVPASRLDVPDDVADVDLGLTAERAAELAANTAPIDVAPPTEKGA